MIIKTVMDVCATEWLGLCEAPDYFAFRCLIKFAEHGASGPSCPYICTGLWAHSVNAFIYDNEDYGDLTPVSFIPLYDQIHP